MEKLVVGLNASIKTKIILSTQIVMVFVVVFGSLATFFVRWNILEQDFQARASRLVRMVAFGLANDVWTLDRDGIHQVVSASFMDDEVLRVRLVDPQGQVLYEEGRRVPGNDSTLSISLPILRNTVPLALLDVQFSRGAIWRSLTAETGLFLLLMVGLTLGTFVGNSWAAARILRPLRDLVDAIEDFGDGRIRLPPAQSGAMDEIAAVHRQFLRMSEAVEANNNAVHRLAYFDTLTGLPNRTKIYQELSARIERHNGNPDYRCQLSIVDIDNFQVVNDTFGLATGDHVLKEVAARLREVSDRHGWWVGRLGDDEFLVLVDTIGGSRTYPPLTLVTTLCGPSPALHLNQKLTVSVGHSTFPHDGQSLAALLRASDTALMSAKAAGKACERTFSSEMAVSLRSRMVLESELEQALERGELHLEFQPQYCTEQRRVGSFEALVRWNNRHLGPVAPSLFIPVAERTGVIIPLGYWVLESAARFIRTVPSDDVTVSVNLSAVQFLEEDLVERVEEIVRQAGVDPRRLVLEITESVFIQSFQAVSTRMDGLRALGFRLSLDDFGTGYSSLSYLGNIRFDELKIDRSFLVKTAEDPSSREIFKSIVGLAKGLGMTVVVEGVEHPEQLEFCRHHGCHKIQGYLLSRPLLPDHAQSFLSQEATGVWS